MRYFERQYPSVEIDKINYSDILICGFRYQLESDRYFVIGSVMASSDDNIWGTYIQSSKILFSKVIGEWNSGWISIN